jgi:ribosomal protein S18 acetylase RimI-like enzyme
MDFSIREATPADASALAATQIACWQNNYRGLVDQRALDAMDVSAWTERRLAQLTNPLKVKLLAEAGGRVIGFSDGGPPREPMFSGYGEIYSLYVHPEAQGGGVGRRLFLAVAQKLFEKGYARLVVKTLATNPQSRAFYERQGGEIVGESSFEFGGRSYPEVAYGYDLPLKGLSNQ